MSEIFAQPSENELSNLSDLDSATSNLYQTGSSRQVVKPWTDIDKQVESSEQDSDRMPRAAYEAIARKVNRRDVLSPEDLQGITGLPIEQTRTLFQGMVARGLISSELSNRGTSLVMHPDEPKSEKSRKPLTRRLLGRLGFVATQSKIQLQQYGASVNHTVRSTSVVSKPNHDAVFTIQPGNTPNRLVITDSSFDNPKYYNTVKDSLTSSPDTSQKNTSSPKTDEVTDQGKRFLSKDRQTSGKQSASGGEGTPIEPRYARYFDTDELENLDAKIEDEIRQAAQSRCQAEGVSVLPRNEFKFLSGEIRQRLIDEYTGYNLPDNIMAKLKAKLYSISNTRRK